MDSAGDHRRGKMMRAGDHVGDDFGLGWIRNRRLQHADIRGGPLAEPDLLAYHRRIALEHRGPEAIGEDGCASSTGPIVVHVEQPAENRVQTHHVEIRTADNPGANFAGLAQAYHGEADDGEIADGGERFHAGAQILDFRYREVGILNPNARGSLADVDQAVFVAIDQWAEQYA